MAAIGKFNELKVVKELAFGLYLDAHDLGDILLPRRYVPQGCGTGDSLKVFIYLDSEDRIIATTDKPFATVDEFILLKVVSTTSIGAFLDWGLAKDLMVPFREQKEKMKSGRSYIVRIVLDEKTQRLIGTTRLERWLGKIDHNYQVNEEVDIIVADKTDLGYKAIINNNHWGIIYENEVFTEISYGQKMKAFIKNIRDDNKIDLYLQKGGYEKIDDLTTSILTKLREHNNFLEITDKSKPEIIYKNFGVSKKTFKKALGSLYKRHLIKIEDTFIKINNI